MTSASLQLYSLKFSRRTKIISDYSGETYTGGDGEKEEEIFGLLTRKGMWQY